MYTINKGINTPIEFKGLKAQYIWWLAAAVLILLIVFAILFILGVNAFICVGLVLLAGTGLFMHIYCLSNTYGEHGMMKKFARRKVPTVLHCYSRRLWKSH